MRGAFRGTGQDAWFWGGPQPRLDTPSCGRWRRPGMGSSGLQRGGGEAPEGRGLLPPVGVKPPLDKALAGMSAGGLVLRSLPPSSPGVQDRQTGTHNPGVPDAHPRACTHRQPPWNPGWTPPPPRHPRNTHTRMHTHTPMHACTHGHLSSRASQIDTHTHTHIESRCHTHTHTCMHIQTTPARNPRHTHTHARMPGQTTTPAQASQGHACTHTDTHTHNPGVSDTHTCMHTWTTPPPGIPDTHVHTHIDRARPPP